MHSPPKKPHSALPRPSTIGRWIAPLVLCAAVAAIWASGLLHSLDLEAVKAARGEARTFIDAHYAAGIALFSLIYIAVVALSLPAASLLTLLGGFLFGVTIGVAVVAVSATIGATIIFLVARSSFGAALRDRAGTLYHKIAGGFNDNAFTYLLFLRLAPVFPFVLINIIPALVNMKTRDFIVATFIGILPGTTVYVYTGQSLGAINTLSDLASPSVLLAFGGLSLLALVPAILKKIKSKSKSKSTAPAKENTDTQHES